VPNKTIYVRDEDLPVWDAAAAAAGEGNLSLFVVDALRRRQSEPEPDEMQRIVLTLLEIDDQFGDYERQVAFWGRWLIEPSDSRFGVAFTRKGQLLLFDPDGGEYWVFATVDALAADIAKKLRFDPPPELIETLRTRVAAAQVEELDI